MIRLWNQNASNHHLSGHRLGRHHRHLNSVRRPILSRVSRSQDEFAIKTISTSNYIQESSTTKTSTIEFGRRCSSQNLSVPNNSTRAILGDHLGGPELSRDLDTRKASVLRVRGSNHGLVTRRPQRSVRKEISRRLRCISVM